MRALGFPAETFASAEDFLRSDGLRSTACLIADVQMPQMSGLELYNHLVASGLAIPTILITAYPDEAVRVRALEAGVVCYLAKPFNKDTLLGCIHSAIGHRKAGEGSEGGSE
jgi:FixJ family two-component response regulator